MAGVPIVAVAMATATGAVAQVPAKPDDSAALAAKIDALEQKLSALAADLATLKQAQSQARSPAARSQVATAGDTKASQTPSSPATASAGAAPAITASAEGGQPATTGNARGNGARTPTFGEGVPTSAAVARIDAGHPVIATSDGRFTASLLGVMHFDVADYFQGSAGPLTTDLRRGAAAGDTAHARDLASGSNFRRARIGIGGRVFGDFQYTVLYEFGGSGLEDSGHIQELWLQYSGWKPAYIRVGAFAPFIGLEDAGSTNGMLFLERPAPADIARSLAGGDFREAGQITFNGPRWFASTAVTGRLVNTAGAAGVPAYDNQIGAIGRVAVLAVKTDDDLVHLGLHGSYVARPANIGGPDAAAGAVVTPVELRERPELRVDGTRLIDTGSIDARHAFSAGVEVAAQHKNLMIQGEYEKIGIDRRLATTSNPRFSGYYIEGSWILTGEKRRYNSGNFAFDGPQVAHGFDPQHGHWGAVELAARYSDIDLNYRAGVPGSAPLPDAVRGGDQSILTAGVNWYLNSVARVMLDYQHVRVSRLSPNATTFLTPVGAEIGQEYSTGSMRFQLAF